eukprot:gb/GECG01015586.1/.p1 GENE.gb/GECG01015586.1/~~gb/GECG01015586.1/.p1  ORF type:complete len:1274 (+),score=172.00 gb/GECG01015586.1/:1-3822(+)
MEADTTGEGDQHMSTDSQMGENGAAVSEEVRETSGNEGAVEEPYGATDTSMEGALGDKHDRPHGEDGQNAGEERPQKQRRKMDQNHPKPNPDTAAQEFVRRPRIVNPEEKLKDIDEDVHQSYDERNTRTALLLIGETQKGAAREETLFRTARELHMNMDNNWDVLVKTLVDCATEIPGRVCEYAALVSMIVQLQSKGTTDADLAHLKRFRDQCEKSKAPIRHWESCLDLVSDDKVDKSDSGFAGAVLTVLFARFWNAVKDFNLHECRSILRFLCELVASRVLRVEAFMSFLVKLLESTNDPDFTVRSYHCCYLVLSALVWLGDVLLEGELLSEEEIAAGRSAMTDALDRCTSFVTAAIVHYRSVPDELRTLTDASRGAGATRRLEQSALCCVWQAAYSSVHNSNANPIVHRVSNLVKDQLCGKQLPEDIVLPVYSWLWTEDKDAIESIGGRLGIQTEASALQYVVYPHSSVVTLVGPSLELVSQQVQDSNLENNHPHGMSVALSSTDAVAGALGLRTSFQRLSLLWTSRSMIDETIHSHYPFHTDAAAAIFSLEDYLSEVPVIVLAIEQLLLPLCALENTATRYHSAYYVAVLVDIMVHDVSQRERRQQRMEERVQEGKRLHDQECSASDAFGIYMRILFKRLPWLGNHVWKAISKSLSHYLNNADYNFIWSEWMHVFDLSYYGFESGAAKNTLNRKTLRSRAGEILNANVATEDTEGVSPASCFLALVMNRCPSLTEELHQRTARALALQVDPQYQLVRGLLNHVAAYMGTWQRVDNCGKIFPRGCSSLVPAVYPEAVNVCSVSEEIRTELLNRLRRKEDELTLGTWLWSLSDEQNSDVVQACVWRARLLFDTIIVYGQTTYRNIRILIGRYTKLLRAFLTCRVTEAKDGGSVYQSLSQSANAEGEDIGPFLLVEREVCAFGSLENMMITFHENGPRPEDPLPDEMQLKEAYSTGGERNENVEVVANIYRLCHQLWATKIPEAAETDICAELATVGFAGRVSTVVLQQCIECCAMSPESVIQVIGSQGGPTAVWLEWSVANIGVYSSMAAIPNDTWESLFYVLEIAHGERDSAHDALQRVQNLTLHSEEELNNMSSETETEQSAELTNQTHYFRHKQAHAAARVKRANLQWHKCIVAALESFLRLHYQVVQALDNTVSSGNSEHNLEETALLEVLISSYWSIQDQANHFLKKWGPEVAESTSAVKNQGGIGELLIGALEAYSSTNAQKGVIHDVELEKILPLVKKIVHSCKITFDCRHGRCLKRDEGVPYLL